MDEGTLESIAEFICGDDRQNHPVYRSGNEITQFFQRAGLCCIKTCSVKLVPFPLGLRTFFWHRTAV